LLKFIIAGFNDGWPAAKDYPRPETSLSAVDLADENGFPCLSDRISQIGLKNWRYFESNMFTFVKR
jgi:hypothetical protein